MRGRENAEDLILLSRFDKKHKHTEPLLARLYPSRSMYWKIAVAMSQPVGAVSIAGTFTTGTERGKKLAFPPLP